MAFTGTAAFQMISTSIVRITGLSLAAGASGTIGLATRTTPGEQSLPAAFQPEPYESTDLIEAIDVQSQPTNTGGILVAVPVNVSKAGGTPQTWLATLTNPSVSATNQLEIYARFNQ